MGFSMVGVGAYRPVPPELIINYTFEEIESLKNKNYLSGVDCGRVQCFDPHYEIVFV